MVIIDFILHIDQHLAFIIAFFGPWTYVVFFTIIFAETGLVVAPFLPGDSLLFAIGTFAGSGFINLTLAYAVLVAAAILGDTVNYWLGYHIGLKVFAKENSRIFKKAYLEKTQGFYERYGGKAIILARFLPIIRTFAPFVAGIGKMNYAVFFVYNVIGALLWVTVFTFAGYFFGGLPFVKKNFDYIVLGIIAFSLLPMIIEYVRHRRQAGTIKEPLDRAVRSEK